MNKQIATIVGVVVAAVLLVGGLFVYLGSNSKDDTKNNTSAASGTSVNQQHAAGNNEMPAQDSQSQGSGGSDGTIAGAQETSSVAISDMAFAPKQITVKAGTTVTWTNQDNVQHDVTADNPSADAPGSELLSKGESYSFTFKKAGVYSYHCTPHPFMKGTVTVTE